MVSPGQSSTPASSSSNTNQAITIIAHENSQTSQTPRIGGSIFHSNSDLSSLTTPTTAGAVGVLHAGDNSAIGTQEAEDDEDEQIESGCDSRETGSMAEEFGFNSDDELDPENPRKQRQALELAHVPDKSCEIRYKDGTTPLESVDYPKPPPGYKSKRQEGVPEFITVDNPYWDDFGNSTCQLEMHIKLNVDAPCHNQSYHWILQAESFK